MTDKQRAEEYASNGPKLKEDVHGLVVAAFLAGCQFKQKEVDQTIQKYEEQLRVFETLNSDLGEELKIKSARISELQEALRRIIDLVENNNCYSDGGFQAEELVKSIASQALNKTKGE